MYYCLFGCVVEVNCPLPGLVALPGHGGQEAQVRMSLGPLGDGLPKHAPACLWYQTPSRPPHPPLLTVWHYAEPAAFHFVYGDGTEFLVDAAGQEIQG